MQVSHHSNTPGWSGMPWFWDLVQLSAEIPLQLPVNTSQTVRQPSVSQQSTTSQPPRLVSRSAQLQEQGFSVKVAERIASLKDHQQGPSTSQVGLI